LLGSYETSSGYVNLFNKLQFIALYSDGEDLDSCDKGLGEDFPQVLPTILRPLLGRAEAGVPNPFIPKRFIRPPNLICTVAFNISAK